MRAVVRKGLTKAKILDESRALVDAGGATALTMRALAVRLGVAPMALYNHFLDRDAILDAIAGSVFEQLRESAAEASALVRRGTHWQRKLKTVVMSAQRLAAQHPHTFRIAFTRPHKPDSAFALAAESIGVLRDAGLSQAEALTAYHAFVILLQGYPFWIDGLENHGASMSAPAGLTGDVCLPLGLLPPGWTADRQFEAIVDWLLSCTADAGQKRKRLSKPS